jgi:hypothetical protein
MLPILSTSVNIPQGDSFHFFAILACVFLQRKGLLGAPSAWRTVAVRRSEGEGAPGSPARANLFLAA